MSSTPRNSVDLHTHTARSDGVLEPLELYAQMRAWGSALVAITDHDTLAGVRELRAAGLGGGPGGDGPVVIVGVEINTLADDAIAANLPASRERVELHVLGLGIDADDAVLEARLAAQRAGRRERLERTLDALDRLGLPVRERLPAPAGGIDALGRPHVARALVAAGHAGSVDDAFHRFLEPGRPAYVRRAGMGTREAIEAVRAAGGLAVLAHAPWSPEAADAVDRLVSWGLGGLEVFYAGWDDATIDLMARFARARRLLATGGSDYHGDDGDYAAAQAAVHVPPDVGATLLAWLGTGPR